MNESEILDVARDGIWVLVAISAPVLVTGLVIGVAIALVQTLTQIQEMTLVFVPKIIAVFVALIFFLPFMLHELEDFTLYLMDKIITLGG